MQSQTADFAPDAAPGEIRASLASKQPLPCGLLLHGCLNLYRLQNPRRNSSV